MVKVFEVFAVTEPDVIFLDSPDRKMSILDESMGTMGEEECEPAEEKSTVSLS